MDAPVLSPPPEFSRLLSQDDGSVRLLAKEEHKHEREGAHEAGDVARPRPAEIRVHDDEAADEGRHQGPAEDDHGEQRDRHPARPVVEHVGEYCADDGEGRGGEEAAPEAAQDDRLQVFCRGYGELEEHEAEHGDQEWEPPAAELGEGAPEQRPRRESEDVERDAQDPDLGAHAELLGDHLRAGGEETAREGGTERGIAEGDGDDDLTLHRPVEGMSRIVLAVKLDDVFLLRGKCGWVGFPATELWQR